MKQPPLKWTSSGKCNSPDRLPDVPRSGRLLFHAKLNSKNDVKGGREDVRPSYFKRNGLLQARARNHGQCPGPSGESSRNLCQGCHLFEALRSKDNDVHRGEPFQVAMSFPENLARLRLKRGLTQQALAERMGDLDKMTVSHFETGRREPSFKNLLRLQAALDCSWSELMGGDPGEVERSIKEASDSQLIHELNRRVQKTGVRFLIHLPAKERPVERVKLDAKYYPELHPELL